MALFLHSVYLIAGISKNGARTTIFSMNGPILMIVKENWDGSIFFHSSRFYAKYNGQFTIGSVIKVEKLVILTIEGSIPGFQILRLRIRFS